MRARWLKPEFFRDRKIGKLGPIPALVFQSLWCTADDGGVSKADPEIVWGEMFCYWSDVTQDSVSAALIALSKAERIDLYAIGDVQYALVRNWRHQNVHRPSAFRHPRPSTPAHHPEECGTGAALVPHSSGTPRLPDSYTPRHLDTYTTEGAENAEEEREPDHALPENNAADFERFMALYPKRSGGTNKSGALRNWNTCISRGLTPAYLHGRADAYAAFIRAAGKEGTDKVLMASTFLGRDRRYEDDYAVPAPTAQPDRVPEPQPGPLPKGMTADYLKQMGYTPAIVREA